MKDHYFILPHVITFYLLFTIPFLIFFILFSPLSHYVVISIFLSTVCLLYLVVKSCFFLLINTYHKEQVR